MCDAPSLAQVFLKRYFDLLLMFDAIDASDDRRIELPEFLHALPLLKSWGVELSDPEADWLAMDEDCSGRVHVLLLLLVAPL